MHFLFMRHPLHLKHIRIICHSASFSLLEGRKPTRTWKERKEEDKRGWKKVGTGNEKENG